MTLAAFYSPGISPAYLRLLKFARISKGSCPDQTDEEPGIALETINSLHHENVNARPLLPLIYRGAVKTGLFEKLNTKTQLILKHSALNIVAAEMSNQHWLKVIIDLFEANDMSIILLKGAAFANNLYPPDAPRQGADLDILVKSSDFDKACELLGETMNPAVMAADRLATHEFLFERAFTSEQHLAPVVEIHRGLTNPHIFHIEEKTLWVASRKHPEYDSELVRILSPEDTLLHLATHAFRDLNFCTHNLLDTHEVICQQDVDIDVLVQSATNWGATKVLYCLLSNARLLMGTPVEKALLKTLEPNRLVNGLNKKILQLSSPQDFSKSLKYRLIQLASQFTFPDRATGSLRFQAQYARTRVKDLFYR